MNRRLTSTASRCSLLLFLGLLTNQPATAAVAKEDTTRTFLHGRVFDRHTGRPIATAAVRAEDLHKIFQMHTHVNRFGRYTLGPLPPGLYFLDAEASDYSEKFRDGVVIGKNSHVGMDWSLRYAGAIRGVVRRFPSGRPLPGVAITATQAEYPWTGFGTTATDAHGRFVIYNLDAVGSNGQSGTIYEVSTLAMRDGYRDRKRRVAVGMAQRPHRITGHVRFNFHPTLKDSVRGRVTDETGQPLPDVSVDFMERDNRGESHGSATTDSRGNYRIDGLDRPGAYLGVASSDEVYEQEKRIKLKRPRVVVLNVIDKR